MIFFSKELVGAAIDEGRIKLYIMSNGVICSTDVITPDLIQNIVSHRAYKQRFDKFYGIYDRRFSVEPITGMVHGSGFMHGLCQGPRQSMQNVQQ